MDVDSSLEKTLAEEVKTAGEVWLDDVADLGLTFGEERALTLVFTER